MKYNEFKNHINKRLRAEFGFKKEGKGVGKKVCNKKKVFWPKNKKKERIKNYTKT